VCLIARRVILEVLIQIFRGIILRGAELQDLWKQGLILALMSVLMITVSALRFRKKTS